MHIHPAHRSVGVSGVASSFRRYRPAECPSAGKPMDAPIRVLLVSRRDYKLSAAAMAAFEGTLRGRDGIQCNRMDLARFEEEGLAEADCAVVFGRGLQIIGRWSDIDAELAGEDGVEEDEGFQIEIEVPAAARWHPVVKGIGPFVGRAQPADSSRLRPDVVPLLVTEWAGTVLPIAWVQEGGRRAFYTLLGDAGAFGRWDFTRLLLNAIEWMGRGG
ncbi:MAG: hypothetical protein WBL72_05225 [Thermoguttaceae bacterium]